MSWIRAALLCGVAALVGCGKGGEAVKAPDTTAKENIKRSLEGIAERGQGGSEIGAVMNELQKLKSVDAALAEELIQDAQAFMSTALSSEQIKAKAKEMLGKLEKLPGS